MQIFLPREKKQIIKLVFLHVTRYYNYIMKTTVTSSANETGKSANDRDIKWDLHIHILLSFSLEISMLCMKEGLHFYVLNLHKNETRKGHSSQDDSIFIVF